MLSFAMEPAKQTAFDAIKPCSAQECAQLKVQFEAKNCDQHCRIEHLKKLAQTFDLKKDGSFLRALLCADKIGNLYTFNGADLSPIRISKDYSKQCPDGICNETGKRRGSYVSTIGWVETAVANNNIDFMKVLFKLFSAHESDPDFNESKYEPYVLGVTSESALNASPKMVQLIFDNLQYTNDWGVKIMCTSHRAKMRPGCKAFMAQLTEIERRDLQKKLEQQQKYEKELRDIANSTKF